MEKNYILFVVKYVYGEDEKPSVAHRAFQATHNHAQGVVRQIDEYFGDDIQITLIEATPIDLNFTPVYNVAHEVIEQVG